MVKPDVGLGVDTYSVKVVKSLVTILGDFGLSSVVVVTFALVGMAGIEDLYNLYHRPSITR